MLEQARPGKSAVVIGGGLLGLEAAYGLKKRGMTVTVVHLMDRLMDRQRRARRLAAAALAQERGIEVVLDAETQEAFPASNVSRRFACAMAVRCRPTSSSRRSASSRASSLRNSRESTASAASL
jgi:NAD(P)H-nitrite reductase large subunit